MPKVRIDQLLVERGLADSRARAQALILAGCVYSGTQRLDKAGQQVADDVPLELRGRDHPWVSRGGVKLAHGLTHFGISPKDRVCLDIGASTGGFTDVLIKNGAMHVYAVDVGYGQLAHELRENTRVTVLERTNARYLTADRILTPPSLIVCDASFISLATVLAAPLSLAARGAELVALIKPQFELGRDKVGRSGVVRDPVLHDEACRKVAAWLTGRGWVVRGICESPITGPKGNREFLVAAASDAAGES